MKKQKCLTPLAGLLLLAQACSPLNGATDSSDAGVDTDAFYDLSLTAAGTETGNCQLTGVKPGVTARSQNAPMGFDIATSSALASSDDIAVADFALAKDGEVVDFSTTSSNNTDQTLVTVEAHQKNLSVSLHNLDIISDESNYTLTIPVGAVTCADGSSNSSSYTLSFTMTPCTLTPLCWEQSHADGVSENASCEIQWLENFTTTSGLDDFSSFDLEVGFMANREDWDAAANPDEQTVADVNADKFAILQDDESWPIRLSQAYGYDLAGHLPASYFAFTMLPEGALTSGDYTLQILPGAFECVDGSQNEVTYDIDFTLNDL